MPEHPFYAPTKGWTEAVHLRAGDKLLNHNGEMVVVEQVQHEILEAPVTVYNFEVADYHTYFVGTNGVLVHNSCYKGNRSLIGRARGNAPRSNQSQTAQFRSIVKEFKLDKYEARILHDSITHQGLSRNEIIEELISIFPGKAK